MLGDTPLYIDKLELNNIPLTIKKEHYKPLQINPTSIELSSIYVKLEPTIDLKKIDGIKINQKKRNVHRNKILTYSLLALTIGSGFTATYLKYQANLKYDLYLAAGNPQDMNRYFSESKKLDKYYSISLVLFEVSFGLSLYFLVKKVGY